MAMEQCNDAQLVSESLTGSSEAFGRIVERYQRLICALTYSATGQVAQSEDLAQETFLIAWKELRQLRDGDKLRSWLCSIARSVISRSCRRQNRQLPEGPASPERVAQVMDPDPAPSERAISREEETIVWQSIQQLPENYRQCLVLFYREHQSIQRVAEATGLSEDVVKQRLARGRKVLQGRVRALVEATLERTNPGKTFTLGVLAALPMMSASAKVAVAGAAAAKSAAAVKATGLAGLFNAALGMVGMVLGPYVGYRMDVDDATTGPRRRLVTHYYRALFVGMAAFVLALVGFTLLGPPALLPAHPVLFTGLFVTLGAGYLIVLALLTVRMRRSWSRIERDETVEQQPSPILRPLFEYRSQATLLGLPLVHIRLRAGLERGPVKAWMAVGDAAIGLIFAAGGLAIAPISFGGIATGVLTLGGLAVGIVPFGGFSVGAWALGGLAVGWQAMGGCAVGWSAAEGGVALSGDFALGAVAVGRHANDALAQAFISQAPFFERARTVLAYAQWLNLLWLVPLGLWWLHRSRRARGSAEDRTALRPSRGSKRL